MKFRIAQIEIAYIGFKKKNDSTTNRLTGYRYIFYDRVTPYNASVN